MKENEKIHISIVIDDENSTRLEIAPDDDVNNLLTKVVEKYSLNENVKTRLKKYIDNYLNVINENFKIQKKERENILVNSVERLYYKAKDKRKIKEEYVKKMKEEEFNANLKECSFKPKINFNSQKFFEKKSLKIEEKLHLAGRTYKEKNQIRRIINDVKSRNEEEYDMQRSQSFNHIKTTNKNNSKDIKVTTSSVIPTSPQKDDDIKRFSFSSNSFNNIALFKSPKQIHDKSSQLTFSKNNETNNYMNESPLLVIPISPNINSVKESNPKLATQIFKFDEGTLKAESSYANKVGGRQPSKNINNHPDKSNNEKCSIYEKLYSKGMEMQEKQKERLEIIKRNEYTFSPEINIKSKLMREKLRESKDDFVVRMAYPPKKSMKESISKVINEVSDSINNKRSDRTTKEKKTTSEINSEKSNYSSKTKSYSKTKFYINNEKVPDSHHTPSLIQNIEKEKKMGKKLKTNVQNKVAQNLDNFKLNNLKEIFEIVYRNCSNIDDLENLENHGIPIQIKEKLVIPTCQIMLKRNLELNFQNFYLIANEIMNFILNN